MMFYYFGRFVMWVGMHLLYRVKVTGREHIPADGGFILCANHIHGLDPVMLAVVIKRSLRFMAKKELFENKLTGFFLGALGAFPVDRGAADMRSYKRALEILSGGSGLLIFSQGHRMKEFMDAKNGAALFALKANVPIVPVGISGSYKFFSPVTLRFGAPVTTQKYKGQKIKTETVSEMMEEVISAVKELSA